MDGRPNPAAKMFGAQLRHLRRRAGLDPAQLGAAIGNSRFTIESWERGVRTPHPDTIRTLDELLNADDMLTAVIEQLASPLFPGQFAEYAELEVSCVSLYSYNALAIPGLLQTEDYARAVIGASVPPLDDEDVERLVAARIERQVLLTRKPQPVVSFVIEEIAIRRPIGGKPVLREQLKHIAEVADMRNVTIQVMPIDVVEHSGLEGPMILIRTYDGRDLVYIEGQVGGVWATDATQAAIIAQRHGRIQTQALRAAESIELIERITGDL
ncbi:helix-turn-helix domain-containing protein [Embleya scabrispora]|uniref:helix-turn-helix domain-containing protein n=1 Tax=Embleya scabrispora TaxID=159449 RepID=UPI001374D7BD|nr:helix-turn-helix transcriptional regulator [Embleya scabrispora]